jgi:hypothetical protein
LSEGLLGALFRLGSREQRTTARDLRLGRRIGEESGMPDPHEALGQDVEQEATDELIDIEAQDS